MPDQDPDELLRGIGARPLKAARQDPQTCEHPAEHQLTYRQVGHREGKTLCGLCGATRPEGDSLLEDLTASLWDGFRKGYIAEPPGWEA